MMYHIFENRTDAGKALAKKLDEIDTANLLLLAIPRGGVPVAAAIAKRLKLQWSLIVVKKLPVPWNPEAGFGAVTCDGSVVLNESMLHTLSLSHSQVNDIVQKVRNEVMRRTQVYSVLKPPVETLSGKRVVIVDDGIASGYTVAAAIKSVRSQNASEIIVAAPAASSHAMQFLSDAADKLIIENVSPSIPFAIADFYAEWRDLTDDDLIPFLTDNNQKAA